MATADTAKLVAELGLRDKLSTGLDKAIGKVGKFESRIDRLGGHVNRGLGNAARNTERAVVVGIGAAAAGLTYAVKQAVDAESAIAGIAKTVDGDISGLVDSLKTMSNQIPVSFGELAGIAELGGAMGIASKDLAAFTKQVAILGTTTNVSMEDAATALGQMKNVIGLTGDEFDNFAASLVELGNEGESTEAQILEIARRSGGAAKLIGIAKEQTLGWAAAAANLGLNEELAGTAVQRFFLLTQTAVTEGGASLKGLAKIAGTSTKQFKKDFDKNATGALTDFLEGLGGMTKDARLKAIQDIFGKGTGLTRLIVGLSDSMDRNLLPSLKKGTQAWKDATAAQEEADKRFATSASQFITLRNNIDNAAATIGANLLPVLVELSKETTTFLADPQTQANIKAFGKDLAVGAREAVKWLKSLDWNAIGNLLKTAAGFGKGLVDAFTSAPPWVQQFLTVGFVANKFTGGAIGSIIGELGRGLVKGVLGMTAGVVNIKAGVVTGGGLPGAAGAAGAAGAGGWAASLTGLASVLAPAIAAAIGSHVVTTEVNKGLGTNLTNPLAGGIGGNIVSGLNNLAEIIRLWDPNKPTPGATPKTGTITPTSHTARRDMPEVRQWHYDNGKKVTTAVETLRAEIGPSLSPVPVKLDKIATNTVAAGVAAKNAGAKTKAATITAGLAAKNAGLTVKTATVAAGVAAKNAGIQTKTATQNAGIRAAVASRAAGATTAAAARAAGVTARSGGLASAVAIRAKRWQFTVNNTVRNNITVRDLRAANTNFQTRTSEFG